MTLTTFVSVVSLSIVGTLCTVGVFYNGYKENAFERIGASLLAIWCFSRIAEQLGVGVIISPELLLLDIGLAILFIGLAISFSYGAFSHHVESTDSRHHWNT